MSQQIILVDKNDNPIGASDKLEAHKEGRLHRAFSIFVFNSKNELLLQKRAKSKYHSPCLWSNTCCSHQKIGHSLDEDIHTRLKEEMGFDCELKKLFSFTYKVEFKDIRLYEHEIVHIFTGNYDGEVMINIKEVDDYRWVDRQTLLKDVELYSEKYTYWFKLAIKRVLDSLL